VGHGTNGGQVLRAQARLPPPRADLFQADGPSQQSREGQRRAKDLAAAFAVGAVNLEYRMGVGHGKLLTKALGIKLSTGTTRPMHGQMLPRARSPSLINEWMGLCNVMPPNRIPHRERIVNFRQGQF
jgi:hypothetical protein